MAGAVACHALDGNYLATAIWCPRHRYKTVTTDEECDDEVGSNLRHVVNDAFLARCYRLSCLGLYRRSPSSRHHIVRARHNVSAAVVSCYAARFSTLWIAARDTSYSFAKAPREIPCFRFSIMVRC